MHDKNLSKSCGCYGNLLKNQNIVGPTVVKSERRIRPSNPFEITISSLVIGDLLWAPLLRSLLGPMQRK